MAENPDPVCEVGDALCLVIGLFTASADASASNATTIVAFRSDLDIDTLIPDFGG